MNNEEIYYTNGSKSSISFNGNNLNVSVFSIDKTSEGNIYFNQWLTEDSNTVIQNVIGEDLFFENQKPVLKPGLFNTKKDSNYIQKISSKSPKWEGPLLDFQKPNFIYKSVSENGVEINKNYSSKQIFSKLVNDYFNNQYVKDIENNLGILIYNSKSQSSWVEATNPEKDYFDSFGYNIGNLPDEKIVLPSLTLKYIFIPPSIYFQSKHPVNIQDFRLLNNNNIEPKQSSTAVQKKGYQRF